MAMCCTMAYHGRPHRIATHGDFIMFYSDGEQPPHITWNHGHSHRQSHRHVFLVEQRDFERFPYYPDDTIPMLMLMQQLGQF